MTTRILLVLTFLCLLLNSTKAQDLGYYSTTYSTKGYLLYYGDFIYFFETHDVSAKVNIKKMSAIKGQLIRSTLGEILLKGLENGKKIDVKEYMMWENPNEIRLVPKSYIITPVALKYYKTEELKMEDGYFSFLYRKKKYTIHYEDNWDIAITELEIIKK